MLVLNRKKGESIVIGEQVEIIILDVQGDNIKIGIEAPRSIGIFRKEIYEEIISANRESSQNLNILKEQFSEVRNYSQSQGRRDE